MTEAQTVADFLKSKYSQRLSKNPRYSVKAFSRDLGVSAATLFKVLSKKRRLSLKMAEGVAERLKLTSDERSELLGLLQCERYTDPVKKREARAALRNLRRDRILMSEDRFKPISEWYYLPILELGQIQGFQMTPENVSRCLGIELDRASDALAKLGEMALIQPGAPGIGFVGTQRDVASMTGKAFLAEMLDRAKLAQALKPIDERDISATITHVRRSDLPALKKLVTEFRRNLMDFAETGEGHDSVYCLSVQLFELGRVK